jgi:hypothetical protein
MLEIRQRSTSKLPARLSSLIPNSFERFPSFLGYSVLTPNGNLIARACKFSQMPLNRKGQVDSNDRCCTRAQAKRTDGRTNGFLSMMVVY